MKIRIITSVFLLVTASLIFSSYQNGPAAHGYDCTGAETGLGNPTGCSTGGGCHSTSATSGITVALELDSAGVPVTGYFAGITYTIKLTGTNTTSSSLPKFGFQVASITGSTAQTTPTNAGTFGTPPSGTHLSTPSGGNYVLNVVEHSSQLAPASGTGGSGTTYVENIPWTAPAAGTGTVSIWAALNAVNNNGSADPGDLWNVVHLAIPEDTIATHTGISEVAQNTGISAYPNPVSGRLNLKWSNAQAGTYTVSVYDMSGNLIATEASGAGSISTDGWSGGVYVVKVESNEGTQVLRVLKQ